MRSMQQHPRLHGRDWAEGEEITSMVDKRRSGRFTWKAERRVIAMAANSATASQIAAKFNPKSVSWTVDIVLPDGSLNLYALVHGG